MDYANNPTKGTSHVIASASYLTVVEFGEPVQAQTLMSYGNASQMDSPHRHDQLALLAAHTLRPVLRTRAAIEAALEERTLLTVD